MSIRYESLDAAVRGAMNFAEFNNHHDLRLRVTQ